MNIITGFVFNDTQMKNVEKILFEIRELVLSKARAKYQTLLVNEISFLIDNITLGTINRPNQSILKAAEHELCQHIITASQQQNGSDYDFNVSLHVFFYDGKTYIRLNAENDIYSKYIKNIEGLFPFDLTKKEFDSKNSDHLDIWNLILKKYEQVPPLGMSLVQTNALFDLSEDIVKKFNYQKPIERADVHARYYITNIIMNKLGNNKEIPPFRTMSYIDMALLSLSEVRWKEKFAEKKSELVKLLPIIDYKMVTSEPCDTIISSNND